MEHEGDSDTNHCWNPRNSPKESGKTSAGTEDQKKN